MLEYWLRGDCCGFPCVPSGAACFLSFKKITFRDLGCLQESGHLIFPIECLLCGPLVGYDELSRSKMQTELEGDQGDGAVCLWLIFITTI